MDTRTLYLGVAAIAAALMASPAPLCAQQAASTQVSVGPDTIGGVVTGPSGPEAGVWVIAETTDLPTRLIKSVVTDDQGRYLIPELPKANYEVFARGYGLKDSARAKSEPGKAVNITTTAATPKEAAEIYPAIYWYSMLKTPAKNEFPLGNAKSQIEWLNVTKTNGCYACHALGNKATRTIPSVFADMKSEDAWARRILSGQAMNNMASTIGRLDAQHALKLFADWTDRIAAGELAGGQAAAAARPGAQRRHHAVGLLRSEALSPRHHGDRQAQADAQSKRPDLRRGRELDRHHPGPRSGVAQGVKLQDAGARSEDAVAQGRSARAFALLGRGGDLGRPDHHAQPDVRPERPGVVDLARRPGAQSGLLQEGLGSSVRQGVPDGDIDAASCDARSEERQDHADPHLLPDAPSGLRRGRQQYTLDERGRSGQRRARLARHQEVRRDRRRGEVARAGRRSSSTPTATASATSRSSRTSRSIPRRTSASPARSTASASIRRTARSGARS